VEEEPVTEYTSNAEFLIDSNSVLDAAKSILSSAHNSHIYISGPFIRPMTDVLMSILNEKSSNPHIFMVVPSITGKDYAGTSFLYYVNLLSRRIRINSKAVHNILAGTEEMLLISYSSRKFGEYTISGVWVKDRMESAKASGYCLELWNNSLPLHFEEKG